MTVFHVVRSVKGGSGKTTFALHQLVKLIADDKEHTNKILYIDADVHASETRTMLLNYATGNTSVNASETCYFEFYPAQLSSNINDAIEQRSQHLNHTLNSFMHPYKGYYSKVSELAIPAKLKQITISRSQSNTVDANSLDENEKSAQPSPNSHYYYLGKAYFIFSDPSPSGRSVFGNLYQSFGKSAVGVGAYIAKIKTLLGYILNDKYTDIVFDMPPGTDAFSEHLIDCLLGFVNKHKQDCKINIYYVSTADNAHVRTATEAAIEHIHTMRLTSAENVYYVHNVGPYSNTRFSLKDEMIKKIKGAFENKSDVYGKALSNISFELSRLSYCQLDNDEQYHAAASNGSVILIANGLIETFDR